MKQSLPIVILTLIITSCSHKITRTGYALGNSHDRGCALMLTKFEHYGDAVRRLGIIQLGESGFAITCSEAHAIEILKNEACSLEANVVNITKEKRPDLWSLCYRCTAELLKVSDTTLVHEKKHDYTPQAVDKRLTKDKKKNAATIFIGGALGFAMGFFLMQ